MLVALLMSPMDVAREFKVIVCWKGPRDDDTVESLNQVYENVSDLFRKLFACFGVMMDLVKKVRKKRFHRKGKHHI